MIAILKIHKHVSIVGRLAIGAMALAGLAVAQDQAPHAWRSVNDPPPAGVAADVATPDQGVATQAAQDQGFTADPQANQAAPPPDPQQTGQPIAPVQGAPLPTNYGPTVPAQLTIKPGTYAIVRTNQWLSSDRNQQGDTFTATLEQPLVVDGVVVAPRGATVIGRVTEAQKAGRVEGTSRLGVQLTELTLADGQQVSVQSQMVNRNGPTSTGRDAAAIGGTTALGAAIGAGVGWGTGAAIGAGAGAAAGIIGVLLTRGKPTVIYPESVLTFQIEAPVTFSTERAPQAFPFVDTQQDYGRQPYVSQRPPAGPYGAPPPPPPAYGYGYYPPYPYAYAYPYPYYPFYGGFSVFVGPRFGYYGYRGFRR